MKTTRRTFIKAMGMSIPVLTAPGFVSFCSRQTEQPNIIFIMSDDHADNAMSCYGKSLIQTPNIDRIADEGVRFRNSFVTNSICAPSRAVLLTGKYSHKNGLRDNRDTFDGSQPTFPKMLQQAGYNTALVGKWHLKSEPTGFDDWRILRGQGQYYNPVFNENGRENTYTGYTTDIITDLALETLESLKGPQPFCMLVHHKAPHRNWMPNTKHLDVFEDIDIPLPETFYDDYEGRPAAAAADMRIGDMYLSHDLKIKEEYLQRETGSGGKAAFAEQAVEAWQNMYDRLTDEQKKAWDAHYDRINKEFKEKKRNGDDLLRWQYQRYIKDYLRCVLSIDENIGRLLDALDVAGLSENTLVIYTSDQGFYLGEHGWYDKRFMYEESLSMPLVMRYPQEIESGQTIDHLVMNLDFAPTMLDYAGVPVPKDMQGRSLKTLIRNPDKTDWRKVIYYHYYEYPHGWHNVKRHYGIRTERYKLIHFYHDIDHWELFDLKTDPNELDNRYDDPEYAEIVQQLKKKIKELQEYYGDTDFEQ